MIDYSSPDFADLPGRRVIPRNYARSAKPCGHIDVSIVTPYCNSEAFFAETFASVQAQSLQNWEWLIVDDGSTEQESVNCLADFAAKDERIKVVRQNDSGTAAARNTGFSHSKGRYICLLDSEDMLEPTYLEKCVWFLDSNSEFAFCNSYSVNFGEQEFLWTTGFDSRKAYLQANSGPPISVIRRTAFEECGGFDVSIKVHCEYWDFWLAMAKAGHWGYTIQEYLQWHRKPGSGRYEQTLQSGDDNDEFAKTIKKKYAGVDKHFPKPSRRYPQPYETIEQHSQVCNPLAANMSGRRIMFIVPWMVTGGAERVNLDLIEGLTRKGHDVTVCATLQAEHSLEHEFTRFTPDVFVLPNFLHASDYPRFLAYLIQSRQIDTVVIAGSIIGYQFIPYLRSVSPGVAFMDMSHVEDPDWLNGGYPRFGVGYQDLLDLNIVTTGHLAEWMHGRGADRSRIRVMYTGIRAPQLNRTDEVRSRLRAELNISTDMPVIVFAGRICAQKRPEMLAEIFKVARDQGLLFRALVIGEGELRPKLKALLRRYRLSTHVSMLGSVPHQRWLDILAASDILLMPSQYEGISIALLEAMAAGVVPVVAKVGGQEEIVSQDAGILIPHGDNELQQYLEALGGLVSEPARLRAMSSRCKTLVVSKFSWEEMISNFQAILDEAHQLKVYKPRLFISSGLGRELASLSLEYKRYSELVGWPMLPMGSQTMSYISMRIAKIVLLLNQTRLGRVITRNQWVRRAGRQVLNKMKRIGSKN
jgi:glycosyltransferase involved in cell wall biosynthesis